jgi:hypothetical protein
VTERIKTPKQYKNDRVRKILVISPTPTHPQNSGSRARIFQLLYNLKQLGYEVHFFLIDKEYRSNHVAQRADIEAMRQAWDGITYLKDQQRMALGGLVDRLGLGPLRGAILPRDARRTKGRMWKVRSWIRDNAWRCRALWSLVDRNLWRVTSYLNQVLRAPFLMRRGMGQTLKVCCPPLYRSLKPGFPDHQGLPLQKLARAANRRGEISQIDSWYNFNMDRTLQALQEQERFDAVIVEYVYLSRALLNFGDNVQKIIDTHDVFTDRNQQYAEIGLVETFFSTSREEESKGLNRADAIIAIQEQEKAFLQELTSRPVYTVGHTVRLLQPKPVAQVRRAVLFIGAANAANIHSVKWFLCEVMPLLREAIGAVHFYVAGQVCAFVEDHEHLIKLGEMSDTDAIYEHADIVVNPAIVGSGLKIKCIEALGRGKVLVSSPHAGAGLHDAKRKPYIEADGAGEFATAITNVCNNADMYNEVALRAYRFAHNYNRTAEGALRDLLCQENPSTPAIDAERDAALRMPLARVSGETHNFIIIASARTGSTTFADLLNAHPAVSCLAEPFNPEHGVKWGKKPYSQRIENGALLYDVVRDIFDEHTGFKHLTEQLPASRNEILIQFPNIRRIFLWRQNHLQRAVSNHISMQSRHWRSDANKILVTNFKPLDIDLLAKNIDKQKRLVDRYRRLCKEAGSFEVAYEDLYGPDSDLSKKHQTLDNIFNYLGIETLDRLPTAVREQMDTLLNPEHRKLNSPVTYQLIPNIAEIENRLGNAENGYLFG